MPGLDQKLAEAADSWCQRNYSLPFEELIKKDQSQFGFVFSMIQSVVGDDENTTTDSAAAGPLIITTAVIVSRIKLSEKDTGISSEVGNYAEGWVLTPPTMDSSF